MPILLNNRYKVIKSLGSGSFGEAFLAEDTQMPLQQNEIYGLISSFCKMVQLFLVLKNG
ncbi:hypothetical protein J0895_18615 [Phormidium pseudopriestleyi FRX01]|uniref:Protein kinase domain-containing protein n=1 Tax=Phormidium pseudopriestleyi FRX01 TaxID=1759528 RepID=A0ABS3FV94_9CYAN|nr:hypothetical protein [Phormidium pseudopriestleyi]MBO0351045.1 hypothetical protein [Phormidium pseudopriestleyi FRX01]